MNKKESKAGMVDPKPDQSQNQRKAEHSQLTISEEEATKLMPGKVSGATAQDFRMMGSRGTKRILIMKGKNMMLKLTPVPGHFWSG